MMTVWVGGSPEIVVSEGVESRVVLAHNRGRLVLTEVEARSLHGWLGRMLWGHDSADRARRMEGEGR